MSKHVSELVGDLVSHIQQGKILEAMDAFYAEDAAMQENRHEPKRGLPTLIEHEKNFLSSVKEFHGFDATSIGVQGGEGGTGTALVESWLEFTNQDDQKIRLEQVSVQRWENGKIKHERFYYDSAP